MNDTDPQTSGDHIEVGEIRNSQAIAIGRGATAVYQGLTIEEVATLVVELKNKDQPTVWNGRIPYLGLSAYQEADARYFFGRESLVEELLQRVQQANFITIAGPSGSGKSSVARAGLFHALREGRAIENSDRWLLATMQPKGDPFGQLAKALEKATKATAVGDALQPQDQNYPTVETLLRHIAMYLEERNGRCVLLVDQFEELFTQTKAPEQRQAFIDLLTAAAQTPDSPLIVVISLRSDFVSNCASHEQLRDLISQQFQLVGAMAPRDLAKAITLPALEVGAEIDPKLVSQIIADMKGSPDALPLMSFALRDLFEAEKTKQDEPMDLTLPEYVQRGGLEKALEEHANKVFNNFTTEQKEIAKNIFSKLIEVGQGRVDTRRTATFAELVPAGKSAAAVTTVLSDLADVRLVTTSDLAVVEGQPVTTNSQEAAVTIAHEKMIDAWPWLRALVDENRDLIALQNQLNNDARQWAKEQDKGYLYRGAPLAQMKARLVDLKPGFNELAETFIQACLAQEEAERKAEEERIQKEEALRQEQANAGRFRRLTRWLAVTAIIAVIATIVALIFLSNSVRQTYAARQAQGEVQQLKTAIQANQLAELAGIERDNDPERALLLAVAGFRLDNQSNTFSHLVDSLQTSYSSITLYGHEGSVSSAVFSPDGQTILTASTDGTARLWDMQGNELAIFGERESYLNLAVFSPDGQTILTAGADGTARLWDRQGNELAIVSRHDGEVNWAVFSPDGQMILTAGSDGTARLWDRQGNELALLSGHEGSVYSALFSPDGQTILTASADGTARLWDQQGNELASLSGHEGSVTSAVFSHDGQTILTASRDGTARLWDQQGNELAILGGHEDSVYSAVFSADGQAILTASGDGTARLWDRQGNQLASLSGHEDSVNSAVFSPDGQTILTASADSTVRLWPSYTTEYMVAEAYRRLQRGFTAAECQQYFRGDLTACPESKRQLFAPLMKYLTSEQQADWRNLEK